MRSFGVYQYGSALPFIVPAVLKTFFLIQPGGQPPGIGSSGRPEYTSLVIGLGRPPLLATVLGWRTLFAGGSACDDARFAWADSSDARFAWAASSDFLFALLVWKVFIAPGGMRFRINDFAAATSNHKCKDQL